MKTWFHAITNRNLFFNFKQFHHHWKLLKTLDFNIYQGFLVFVLYLVISGYFKEYWNEISQRLNTTAMKY